MWLPELHKLFFVSNRLGNQETTDQRTELWTLDPETLETQEIVPSTPILTANGATNWAPSKVLVEQQVSATISGGLPLGLVKMGVTEPLLVHAIVASCTHSQSACDLAIIERMTRLYLRLKEVIISRMMTNKCPGLMFHS